MIDSSVASKARPSHSAASANSWSSATLVQHTIFSRHRHIKDRTFSAQSPSAVARLLLAHHKNHFYWQIPSQFKEWSHAGRYAGQTGDRPKRRAAVDADFLRIQHHS